MLSLSPLDGVVIASPHFAHYENAKAALKKGCHVLIEKPMTTNSSDAEDLFKWLESGAYFYVCGDASKMAKDVDSTLHEIIKTEGSYTTEEAEDYVKKLKKDRRYLRDVY